MIQPWASSLGWRALCLASAVVWLGCNEASLPVRTESARPVSETSEAPAAAPPASAASGAPAAPPASAPVPLTNVPAGKPQPKLQTIKLWLGAREMIAEQALTRPQIERGMMFRTEMAEHEGMLFVFGQPQRVSFYMRNTLLPLSCAYIDSEGVILEIRDMKPLDETPLEANSDRVQYVLETRQGWFSRNGVNVGALVRTERGSLAETYFGGRRD